MDMSEKRFYELLKDPKKSTRSASGNLGKDEMLALMVKDGGIYTTTQVWDKFAKRVVKKMRVREVLHKFFNEAKVARTHDGTYRWSANPEYVAEQQEALRKQGPPQGD